MPVFISVRLSIALLAKHLCTCKIECVPACVLASENNVVPFVSQAVAICNARLQVFPDKTLASPRKIRRQSDRNRPQLRPQGSR